MGKIFEEASKSLLKALGDGYNIRCEREAITKERDEHLLVVNYTINLLKELGSN